MENGKSKLVPPENRRQRHNHRKRHIELHRAFDELLADWIAHDPFLDDRRRSIHSPIFDLMQWSHQQTIEPEP
jgi:hypothetical protein